MKVKELKEILNTLPDNFNVVIRSTDIIDGRPTEIEGYALGTLNKNGFLNTYASDYIGSVIKNLKKEIKEYNKILKTIKSGNYVFSKINNMIIFRIKDGKDKNKLLLSVPDIKAYKKENDIIKYLQNKIKKIGEKISIYTISKTKEEEKNICFQADTIELYNND